MTVQLNWPPEVVDRLTKEADQQGLTLDNYLLLIISTRNLWNDDAGEEERRRRREAAGTRIREMRKGNILGPDTTVRDLIEEGRRF